MGGRDRDRVTVTAHTGDYTLTAGDAGDIVEMDKASGVTVTVPPHESVPFPVGTSIQIVQVGAGQVTVAAGAGVTVQTAETLLLAGQWAAAALYQRALDEWVLTGTLEAAAP